MLGLFLDHNIRKQGLSKILIAIWLDLCVRAGVTPRTGVIHKPLLALVLQHSFGFRPRQDGLGGTQKGVLVEISPGSDGSTVLLYAPFLKSLQGAFAFWDLKRENIRLLQESPHPRGRMCHVGTKLTVGDEDVTELVERHLAGKTGTGSLVYNSMDTCWRQVLLGNRASEN